MDEIVFYSELIKETLALALSLGNKKVLVLSSPKKFSFDGLELLFGNYIEKPSKGENNIGLATRELVEGRGLTYVTDAETLEYKDKTHRRGSGMNQVLAKLIVAKKKIYCFNLNNLLNSTNQGQMMGRMQQNKKILSKYKAEMKVFSFAKEPLELRAPTERNFFLKQL